MTLLHCGAIAIHWLEPSVAIADKVLQQVVHPSEWSQAHAWIAQKRRQEFLRARYVLRRITGEVGPLPKTPAGAPSWPAGTVGSVTHKDGYVGVALAAAADWLSIGIDAEDEARMQTAFERHICQPRERLLLDSLAAAGPLSRIELLTILFSFKESLFKAHFPLGETMFYFHDAAVTAIVPIKGTGGGTVAAELMLRTSPLTPAGTHVSGHYVEHHFAGRRFILTSVGVPRSGSRGNTGSDIIG